MGEATKLGFTFLYHEMYWSSLLIAQSTLPNPSLQDYYYMLSSLLRLGFNKALQSIVDYNQDLLKVREIRLLYVKSGAESTTEASLSFQSPAFDSLDPASVELFFAALSKKETLRKKQLIMAFQQDKRNIEPLIYIYKESLCMPGEMETYISQVENEYLRTVLRRLVCNEMSLDRVICPLLICALACKTAFSREPVGDGGFLFRVCVKNLESFADCEFIYLGMGIYYLKKDRHREALNCFYKAIELNKNSGTAHLLAGMTHSKLKETEYAVKVLSHAYSIMSSSYLPAYCLAYEFQLMNNIQKAKHYFRRSIDLMESCEALEALPKKHLVDPPDDSYVTPANIDCRVVNAFIYCLIYNEEYDEAMRYLDQFNVKNVLRVFCLLFTGKIEEAREALEACEKTGSYFMCKGFIYHLVDDLDNAIQSYEKGLACMVNPVIENLLNMAHESRGSSRPNRAFDYSNCLFESFGFRKRLFD